ncbi:hypothetical protein B0H14DRAFT_2572585 [Mycena olivaceomarginata]|nr:hypothetical protein B0H14DRAFT_2572585 [Mycena olivaceomarginata]
MKSGDAWTSRILYGVDSDPGKLKYSYKCCGCVCVKLSAHDPQHRWAAHPAAKYFAVQYCTIPSTQQSGMTSNSVKKTGGASRRSQLQTGVDGKKANPTAKEKKARSNDIAKLISCLTLEFRGSDARTIDAIGPVERTSQNTEREEVYTSLDRKRQKTHVETGLNRNRHATPYAKQLDTSFRLRYLELCNAAPYLHRDGNPISTKNRLCESPVDGGWSLSDVKSRLLLVSRLCMGIDKNTAWICQDHETRTK